MKLSNTSYLYPPRPRDAVPKEALNIYADFNYVAQFKFNDTRLLIKILPTEPGSTTDHIQLWNRHGEKIRDYHAPDQLKNQILQVTRELNLDPKEWHLLDGGILDTRHQAVKDTIVLWDILVKNGEHLTGTTYEERYNELHKIAKDPWVYESTKHEPLKFGLKLTDSIFIPENHPENPERTAWNHLWDNITIANKPFTKGTIKPNGTPSKDYQCHPVLEGLVVKSLTGTLELGLKPNNNSSWMARSRVLTKRHSF